MLPKALRLAAALGLGFVLSLAWCESPGAATTWTVTDFGDNGSPGQLRTLMNFAASGDTILIPAGTISLSGPPNEDANAGGDLDILKNLIIQGADAGATIIDGRALDGVFDILAPHTLALSGVTIRNGINSAQAGGGGIRNFGTLNLANAIVSGNEAARATAGIRNNGGGIRNLGTMSLTNVSIVGNLARGKGGGIYNEQGSVMTLTDVTVSDNTVEIDGGGIYNLGTATLTRVTVSGNNADTNGGGIFTGGAVVSAAVATLTNVTVSGNHVNGSGGGIFNSATATLTNVTVTDNTANFSGSGIANFGLTNLKNVIVAGNTDALVPGTDNCSGAITSLGSNLDSGAGCALTAPGDMSSLDPLLGPLQDNGGLTFTHALLPGSPAIDAGTNAGCPPTDQRGLDRPQGPACDIGAYEANAVLQANRPPVLDPLVNLVMNEGEIVRLALRAGDPDGTASLTLAAVNLPPFAAFTDLGNGNGRIDFAPAFAQAGSYPGIAVTVEDHDPLNPLSDTKTFDLTVTKVPSTTTSISALMAQVENLNLNERDKNSLMKNLRAAQASFDRRKRGAAAKNQICAFVSKVRALQRKGRLDKTTVASLIAQAWTIVYKRPLQ